MRTFVFTGDNVSGVEMAELIIEALPRMRRLLASTPGPFIARITAAGHLAIIA